MSDGWIRKSSRCKRVPQGRKQRVSYNKSSGSHCASQHPVDFSHKTHTNDQSRRSVRFLHTAVPLLSAWFTACSSAAPTSVSSQRPKWRAEPRGGREEVESMRAIMGRKRYLARLCTYLVRRRVESEWANVVCRQCRVKANLLWEGPWALTKV